MFSAVHLKGDSRPKSLKKIDTMRGRSRIGLGERLTRDTFCVGDLPFCCILLMNHSRWPLSAELRLAKGRQRKAWAA